MEQSERFAIIGGMREPSPRSSRLAIAGGLVAAVALAGAGFLLGRATMPAPPPAPPPKVSEPSPPPQPVEPDVLGRAELIALGNDAAARFAAGSAAAQDLSASKGQRVELVLPFGCEGPSIEDSKAPMRWTYDPDRERLRIHVDPVVWQADEWGLSAPDGSLLRLEGFWVARPWATGEQCPKDQGRSLVSSEGPVTLPGQTLAVAQPVADERRQPRGFDIVKRIPAESLDAVRGFHLRVLGRLAELPGGRLVECRQTAGIEQRPLCLVGMSIDEVRIENPRDDAILATWPMRQGTREPT